MRIFTGPVVCPNCQSPISDEAVACPYCSSFAPYHAPWKTRMSLGWFLLVCLIGLIAWGSDHYLGTQIISAVQNLLESGKE